MLRGYELGVIPGLAQSEDYISSLLTAGRPTYPEERIEAQVAGRLARQKILGSGARFLFIIDEAALARPVGGPVVMADQLERLAELAGHRMVTIQVTPLSIGGHPGVEGAFSIATLPDGAQLVYRDSIEEGQVVHKPDTVATIIGLWESIRADALPQRASIELVRSWAEKWKNS